MSMKKTRGNCTSPKHCTCLCREVAQLDENGEFINGPWQDPLSRALPNGFTFGTLDCVDGYEGIKDEGGEIWGGGTDFYQ